jgi:hypothetical protein
MRVNPVRRKKTMRMITEYSKTPLILCVFIFLVFVLSGCHEDTENLTPEYLTKEKNASAHELTQDITQEKVLDFVTQSMENIERIVVLFDCSNRSTIYITEQHKIENIYNLLKETTVTRIEKQPGHTDHPVRGSHFSIKLEYLNGDIDEFHTAENPELVMRLLDTRGTINDRGFVLGINDNLWKYIEKHRTGIEGSQEVEEIEEWDVLYPFQDQYNKLMGFKDADGNIVIEPQFKGAGRFSEGLASVRDVDGNVGFIDTAGNIVISIPATTSVISGFSEGFAIVIPRRWRSDERQHLVGIYGPYIFIDRTGENVFGMEFGRVFSFRDGLAEVIMLNGNHAFIDRTGVNAFGMEFRRVREFIDGLAIVHLLNENQAFFNKEGNAFGMEFRRVDEFNRHGYARVDLLNGNAAFINRTGENAFGMEFKSASDFGFRYARVVLLDGTATFIDTDGNLHLHRTWG